MNGDEWHLLSPDYFSDMFVSLFNGGPVAFILIFVMLFFGNLLLPVFVRIGRARAKAKRIDLNDQPQDIEPQPQLPARRLSFADAPPYVPGNHFSYTFFFSMSIIGGLLYFIAHLAISTWPARVLTTGEQLQWLAIDDVRALVQFLYRWVLTGYALVVLSITLGLDYIARWMAITRPKTVTTMPAIAVDVPPASAPVLALPDIKPDIIAYLPLEKVTAALDEQTFHLSTSSHFRKHPRKEDDKLLWDVKRAVCVSVQGWIEYDDEWDDAIQRLLRFSAEGSNWYASFISNPLLETSVLFSRDEVDWIILTEKLLLTDRKIYLKWVKDNVIYKCECSRYVNV